MPETRSPNLFQRNPQEKLFAAISILQAYILAEDSTMSGDAVFGVNHFKTAGLELAEALLQDITPFLDDVKAETAQ